MQNKETILNDILNMNLKTVHEATDMLIALYGYMDKRTLADVIIELEKHYQGN